jgi:hypothetical protein
MHMLGRMIDDIATDDTPVYQWLQDLVLRLGNDGMSSDESGVDENGTTVYLVKQLPWRRNIDKELDIVDSLRKWEVGIYTWRGSEGVQRKRDINNPISTREPVRGLPKALYDEAWVKSQPHSGRRLRFAARDFDWMNIYT